MESITLKSGEVVMLDTDRDIQHYLEKYMGYDFASYVYEQLKAGDDIKAYEEARAQTDADAIAEENDELRASLMVAEDELEEIENYIYESKRLDKGKLSQKITACKCEIHNAY